MFLHSFLYSGIKTFIPSTILPTECKALFFESFTVLNHWDLRTTLWSRYCTLQLRRHKEINTCLIPHNYNSKRKSQALSPVSVILANTLSLGLSCWCVTYIGWEDWTKLTLFQLSRFCDHIYWALAVLKRMCSNYSKTTIFQYLRRVWYKPMVLNSGSYSLAPQKNYIESETPRMVHCKKFPSDSKVKPELRTVGKKDLI